MAILPVAEQGTQAMAVVISAVSVVSATAVSAEPQPIISWGIAVSAVVATVVISAMVATVVPVTVTAMVIPVVPPMDLMDPMSAQVPPEVAHPEVLPRDGHGGAPGESHRAQQQDAQRRPHAPFPV